MMNMRWTRSIILGTTLAAALSVGAAVAFAVGAFDSDGPHPDAAVASSDCWSLLAGNQSKLPAAMQTALATAKSDPNGQPGCALQVGGSASGEGTVATGDCWALLRQDQPKLPPPMQTAVAEARSSPNSQPG